MILRLSYNEISYIPSEIFSGLWNLEELHLDNNKIHTIHLLAFENTNIRILNLANNKLDISDNENVTPFDYLGRLAELNMQNNSMHSFLTVWNTKCFLLEKLDLSHNSIAILNLGMIFDFWIQPITVNVCHNRISTIVFADTDDYQTNSTWILNNNPLKCDCLIQPLAEKMQHSKNNVNFVIDDLKCATPEEFVGQSPINIKVEQLMCPLDGPIKMCPLGCECNVRAIDRTLIFNCSNANLDAVPILPDKNHLSAISSYHLYIENNQISQLPMHNESGYKDVTYIYAHNNSIESVYAYNLPNDLNVLDLSKNQLHVLDYQVLLHLDRMDWLTNISLHDNPWICDCRVADLQRFILSNKTRITSVDGIICSNFNEKRLLVDSYLCFWRDLFILLVIIAIIMCIFVLACMLLFYKHKLEFLICIDAYRNRFIMPFCMQQQRDSKEFDAFIAHSIKDIDFVTHNLVNELENGARPLKVCLLDRDGIGGVFMHDVVTKFVKKSRKTIVVLTPNLVESIVNREETKQGSRKSSTSVKSLTHQSSQWNEFRSYFDLDTWNLMAFLLAHQHGLQDRDNCVIIIIYGDIGPIESLPIELKAYLDMNLFLRWTEKNFFSKLRYAINEKYPKQSRRNRY